MQPFSVVLVAIAVTGLGAAFILSRRADFMSINTDWGMVADRFGLGLRPTDGWSDPAIRGRVDDLEVAVDVVRGRWTSTGSRRRTRYRVAFPALGADLRIFRENAAAPSGVPAEEDFYRLFTIRTAHRAEAYALVSAEVRLGLLALAAAHPQISVRDDAVRAWSGSLETDPATMVATLEWTLSVARHLRRAAHVHAAASGPM